MRESVAMASSASYRKYVPSFSTILHFTSRKFFVRPENYFGLQQLQIHKFQCWSIRWANRSNFLLKEKLRVIKTDFKNVTHKGQVRCLVVKR